MLSLHIGHPDTTVHLYGNASITTVGVTRTEQVRDRKHELADVTLEIPKSFLGATVYEDLPDDGGMGYRARVVMDSGDIIDGLVYRSDVKHYSAADAFEVRVVSGAQRFLSQVLSDFNVNRITNITTAATIVGVPQEGEPVEWQTGYSGPMDAVVFALRTGRWQSSFWRNDEVTEVPNAYVNGAVSGYEIRSLMNELIQEAFDDAGASVTFALPAIPSVRVPFDVEGDGGTLVQPREIYVVGVPDVDGETMLKHYSATFGLTISPQFEAFPSRAISLAITEEDWPDTGENAAAPDITPLLTPSGYTTTESERSSEPFVMSMGEFPAAPHELEVNAALSFLEDDVYLEQPPPLAVLGTTDWEVDARDRVRGEETDLGFRIPVIEGPRGPSASGYSDPYPRTAGAYSDTIYTGRIYVGTWDDFRDNVLLVTPARQNYAGEARRVILARVADPAIGAVPPVWNETWPVSFLQLRPFSRARRFEVSGEFQMTDLMGAKVGRTQEGVSFNGLYHYVREADINADGTAPSTLVLERPEAVETVLPDFPTTVGAVRDLSGRVFVETYNAIGEGTASEHKIAEIAWRPPAGPEMGVRWYEVEYGSDGSSWTAETYPTFGTSVFYIDPSGSDLYVRVRPIAFDGTPGPWVEISFSLD